MVVAVSGTTVTLRASTGQLSAVLVTHLVDAADFQVMDEPRTVPVSPNSLLEGLGPAERERVRRLEAHLLQLDTGVMPGESDPLADERYQPSNTVEQRIAAKVIEYRELTKLKSTYIDALPRLIREDRRLHTTFNQTVAATGRLSSSNPNLQNIPVRTELGKRIRAAFVPAARDDVIVSADYSQIELRILAHLSGDEGLIEAFTSGRDFHTETAARVFSVDRDSVPDELRRRAKAVNFGIVYGQTAHGLSESLRIPRQEAQDMIDRYFEAYPMVKLFLGETVADAHRNGFAVTMYGRRRPIPELLSGNSNLRNFGERTAMNHPMQGSAADIMKLAMIAVDRALVAGGYASRLVLQVHDELVFESPRSEIERLTAMVHAEMEGVASLAVPLDVSVSYGDDWAAAK